MKQALKKLALRYLACGTPFALAGLALVHRVGTTHGWTDYIEVALIMSLILGAPIVGISYVMERERREKIMAWVCGLREGDERERVVTGEAARATLLLSLAVQALLLLLSVVTIHLQYQPHLPPGEKKGVLAMGAGFNSGRHLDQSGIEVEHEPWLNIKAAPGAPKPADPDEISVGGFVVAPGAFSVLLLLILVQLAAFKAYSTRRYAGA